MMNRMEPRPLFIMELIDFAHTVVVPGKGPDEGVFLAWIQF